MDRRPLLLATAVLLLAACGTRVPDAPATPSPTPRATTPSGHTSATDLPHPDKGLITDPAY